MNTSEILRRVKEIEARAERATPGPWGTTSKCPIHDRCLWIRAIDGEKTNGVWGHFGLDGATIDDMRFIAHAREDVPWLCQVVRQLVAQCAAMREALETFLMAYDPSWPGACPQECSNTSDGHGYEMQEIAKDEACKALQSDVGRDPLDRLHKLEAVAKAAREYLHDIDAPLRDEPTIYQYEPWEDKSWRLRRALAALEEGDE